jgi:hypothetical protein
MKKLAIGFLFTAAAFAVDPELLKLATPEARILSGVDVAKVKDTPFGKFAMAQLAAAQDPQYDAFVKATGFDPRESIDEILLAKPDAGDRSLALARGRFDTARILEAASAAGAGAGTYQGVRVIISPDAWLAFLSDSIVAMGDPASVRALVERREKGTGPAAEIAARANVVSKAYALWFVSTVPIGELLQDLPSGGAGEALKGGALRSVQSASGGVNFGDSVRLSAELTAASAQDASKLAAVLKFVAGLVVQGPAEVAAEASVVRLGVALTESQLESLWRPTGAPGPTAKP